MSKDMMDVMIKKVALQALLQRVQGAAEKGGISPILRCVLLSVDGGQLHAEATDLEIGIASSANVDEIIGAGRVAVPLRPLLEVVKRMPGPDIQLREWGGQKLLVAAGDAEIKISCDNAAEFPTWTNPVVEYMFKVDADVYQQLIKVCEHSICRDYTKYNLCGMNFKLEGKRLTGCATDGHRLSLASVDADDIDSRASFNHLVSKKALGEIKRLNDGPVQIYVYDNNVAFIQASVSLVIRLVDGEFPAYNKIIPTNNPGSISFAGRDMLDSVDRVRQVAASKSAGIKLEASGNEITLVAESETGSARDIVVAEINGEAMQIAVSAAFLSDAISSLGDDVCAKYKTDKEPMIFFPLEYGQFSERLEVVMPMRL